MTLPKAVLASCPGTEYFEISEDNGRIVLTPVRLNPVRLNPVRLNKADAVRSKLAELGIGEKDVGEAVDWARRAWCSAHMS